MQNDQISFPWEYEAVSGLGKIFRPYVPIYLNTKEAGWKRFDFIVDSGADITMLPKSMLDILGIDKKKITKGEATGIGGFTTKTWQTKIPIKIGEWELEILATFTSENLTPLLLGRVDTLDSQFSWNFDHKKKEILFTK